MKEIKRETLSFEREKFSYKLEIADPYLLVQSQRQK